MSYISLLGHQTWASTGTDKDETVVLLHGGLSNSDLMLDTIGGPLAATYRVAAFDRRGHGRTADTSEPFHYAAMADETIAFLEHLGGPAHLIGWSDGGNVGLLVRSGPGSRSRCLRRSRNSPSMISARSRFRCS